MKMQIDLTKKLNLIQGDCLEILKQLPDKSIDLILTDPPYGINIANKGKVGGSLIGKPKNTIFEIKEWDSKTPSKEYFDEMIRVSKNQIIFGGNYFTDKIPPSSCWIVWDKRGSDKMQNNFADAELAYTSFKEPTRVFRFIHKGMISEAKEKKEHPTQKPFDLAESILKKYSAENDLIMDCFMGGGSFGRAAVKLNRRFIGVEIDKDYFKIAEKRCNEWINQTRLI